MSEPFSDSRDAARAVLTHPEAQLNYKSGQFCGGLMFSDKPLSDRQAKWLGDLLRKHDLPPLADGGDA